MFMFTCRTALCLILARSASAAEAGSYRVISLCDTTQLRNTVNDSSVEIRFSHILAFDREALVASGATEQKTCTKRVEAPHGHVVRLQYTGIRLGRNREIRTLQGSSVLCTIVPDITPSGRTADRQPPETCVSQSSTVVIEFACASFDTISNFVVHINFVRVGCNDPASMDFSDRLASPVYGSCGAEVRFFGTPLHCTPTRRCRFVLIYRDVLAGGV